MIMGFESGYNRETGKDENTGRMIEGVTDDISTPIEDPGMSRPFNTMPVGSDDVGVKHEGGVEESGNERFDAMKEGIGAVMDQYGIRAEEAMGQEDFFMEKLQENGVISAKDMSLSGIYETVRQAVKEVARKRLDKRGDDLQNRKIA